MADAPALNPVVELHHSHLSVVPPLPAAPPVSDGSWWLGGVLLLNGMLVGITAVGAMSTREELEGMASRAQQHAVSAERQAQGLKDLEGRLVDVRRALSAHAREESLFLKMLILKPGLEPALARRIAAAVQANCLLYGQDPNLVLSLIATESGFNPAAVSKVGAVGLMQVMPHWKKSLGAVELTDPEVSIRAGVQILAYYQQLYRDEAQALAAYNRGPGPAELAPVNGGDYPEKVIETWQRLREIDVASRP